MRERMVDLGRRLSGPLAVGVMLGLIGPFGTFEALSTMPRLAYWVAIVPLNWLLCDIAVRWVDGLLPDSVPVRRVSVPLAGAAAVSVPATGVVALANGLSGIGWPEAVGILYSQVLLLLGAISVTVYVMTDLSETAARPGPELPSSGRQALDLFRSRLSRPIEGTLLCLEMQDHYLKVHATGGTDMILCRMEDAARELEGLGRRVHRSWWVADAARNGVERDGQRQVLVLINGARVPVGRTYRPALRAAGWI